jgi:hypothetical protein
MTYRDKQIVKMFNAGESYDTIAFHLNITRNVVAGVCHRLGLKRNPEKPRNSQVAERERDHRDLDILSDLMEGHGEKSTASHHGVSVRHVRSLRKAWREAA